MIANELLCKIRLLTIMRELEKKGKSPLKISLAKHGGMFFSSVSDYSGIEFLDPSGGGAGAETPNLALIKGLMEYVERKVFSENQFSGAKVYNTESIDGTASFPKVLCTKAWALKRAREAALCEAIERFSWATWWENESISAQIDDTTNEFNDELNVVRELAIAIDKLTPVEKWLRIKPRLLGYDNLEVIIFFGLLKNKGIICAGACGPKNRPAESIRRVFSELFRHSYAVDAFVNRKIEAKFLYEHRLKYFGSGLGDSLFHARISKQSTEAIEFPGLEIDESLIHPLSYCVTIHRCLFENQPDFMSGSIEKLCI